MHFKIHEHKAAFTRDGKKLVLRCHNQRISLNLKKRQRNDEEDGQDQVLSLRELKAYLIKNLRILMKNFL